MNLCADNQRLILEQDRILLNRQNLRDPDPSVDNGNIEETRQQQRGAPKTKETRMNNDEKESGNTSRDRGAKNIRIELEGEFKKIKTPLFDGEVKDAVEAWFINMSHCFHIYEYDDNLRT